MESEEFIKEGLEWAREFLALDSDEEDKELNREIFLKFVSKQSILLLQPVAEMSELGLSSELNLDKRLRQ